MATIRPSRTITAGDPGLLSNEELLAKSGGRRRTLEDLIAKDDALGSKSSTKQMAPLLFQRAKQKAKWILDHAQIKISVNVEFMCIFEVLVTNLVSQPLSLQHIPTQSMMIS